MTNPIAMTISRRAMALSIRASFVPILPAEEETQGNDHRSCRQVLPRPLRIGCEAIDEHGNREERGIEEPLGDFPVPFHVIMLRGMQKEVQTEGGEGGRLSLAAESHETVRGSALCRTPDEVSRPREDGERTYGGEEGVQRVRHGN